MWSSTDWTMPCMERLLYLITVSAVWCKILKEIVSASSSLERKRESWKAVVPFVPIKWRVFPWEMPSLEELWMPSEIRLTAREKLLLGIIVRLSSLHPELLIEKRSMFLCRPVFWRLTPCSQSVEDRES